MMIGIDKHTGRTLYGFDQLVSRVEQVLTTPIGAREKRRASFGSRLPEILNQPLTDELLILAQNYALQAFKRQGNGLLDFQLVQAIATRKGASLHIELIGLWQGQQRQIGLTL